MKQNWKSAFIGGVILAGALAGLGGCDSLENIEWPHVYGPNEVPPSVMAEPRDVEVPPPLPPDTTYPRLGDVPMRPKTFTPQPAIDRQKQEMETERAEGDKLKEQVYGAPASAGTGAKNYSFAVTSGTQYALSDSGSEIYTLTADAKSPPIGALQLPTANDDAAQYSVIYLAGTTWSEAQVKGPGAVITIPGASAIKVTLLDINGARIAGPGDMTFYLTFDAGGQFTGKITGNPPISGAANAAPVKQ